MRRNGEESGLTAKAAGPAGVERATSGKRLEDHGLAGNRKGEFEEEAGGVRGGFAHLYVLIIVGS